METPFSKSWLGQHPKETESPGELPAPRLRGGRLTPYLGTPDSVPLHVPLPDFASVDAKTPERGWRRILHSTPETDPT